jgi:Mg2+/citrate symporter
MVPYIVTIVIITIIILLLFALKYGKKEKEEYYILNSAVEDEPLIRVNPNLVKQENILYCRTRATIETSERNYTAIIIVTKTNVIVIQVDDKKVSKRAPIIYYNDITPRFMFQFSEIERIIEIEQKTFEYILSTEAQFVIEDLQFAKIVKAKR